VVHEHSLGLYRPWQLSPRSARLAPVTDVVGIARSSRRGAVHENVLPSRPATWRSRPPVGTIGPGGCEDNPLVSVCWPGTGDLDPSGARIRAPERHEALGIGRPFKFSTDPELDAEVRDIHLAGPEPARQSGRVWADERPRFRLRTARPDPAAAQTAARQQILHYQTSASLRCYATRIPSAPTPGHG
jgi:hypothetical protein